MDNIIGNNFKQFKNVIVRSSKIGNSVVVGDDCFITDSSIGNKCTIERRGMIFNSSIGDYSYTGYNSVIKHASVGKYCSISWNVSIGGANHEVTHLTTHPFPIKAKYGIVDVNSDYDSFDQPLSIGHDVWIGSNVCILRGVSIGNGAVIGAGAVVTHNIAPYEIWAGVPAKKIGQRYDDTVIEHLLKTGGWYDFPETFLKECVDCFCCEVSLALLEELNLRYQEFLKREAL